MFDFSQGKNGWIGNPLRQASGAGEVPGGPATRHETTMRPGVVPSAESTR